MYGSKKVEKQKPTEREKTSAQHCTVSPIAEVFLKEQALADRWDVSIKMLQAARWKGKSCPFVKIGRCVRYRLSDVVKFEAAACRNSTSQILPMQENMPVDES